MKLLLAISLLTASLNAGQNTISRVYASCEEDKLCLGIKLIRTVSKPYTLSGSALIITRLPDGKVTSKETPIIDYTISTDGVPATITFPSHTIGLPDKSYGLFFSGKRLELVGPGCNPRCVLEAK
jgi:hypothetical protein